jgi:hypothetical protein
MYPESAISRPFPFNAYYGVEDAPDLDAETYKFEISGLVDGKRPGRSRTFTPLPRPRRSLVTSAGGMERDR